MAACAGWASKLGPGDLQNILKNIPILNDKNLLIGFKNNDDAAVYKIDSKKSIVFTVDFFTPIVDDPVHYGRISACNSISDVYAMGGKPFLALNVIGFPSNDLENKVLNQILKGAFEITNKAGVV